MLRNIALQRLDALEKATNRTVIDILLVREMLVSQPSSLRIQLSADDSMSRLMAALNDFLHIWRSAPLIVRPLPVCFGRLRGISYTECMAAMVWDLALSIGVWLDFSEIGTQRCCHIETLSLALKDYSSWNGLENIPRTKTTTPIEILGLAVTAEILSERQRCMASSSGAQFDTNDRRRADTIGTVTLWHYRKRDGDPVPRPRPQVHLSDYQRAVLDALHRMGNLTQARLASAISKKENASGNVKKAIAATVQMGLVSPGRKGRGSDGYSLTDSGKMLIETLRNGAK